MLIVVQKEAFLDCGLDFSDAPSWRGSLMVLMRGEWPAHWEPQEEGVMSIAAGFPLVKKPRYVDLGEERRTTEGDAC
jgi:hypothetical protein